MWFNVVFKRIMDAQWIVLLLITLTIFKATPISGLEEQACPGQFLDIFCSLDQTVLIEEAVYGNIDGLQCGLDFNVTCPPSDVTSSVIQRCSGVPGCAVPVRDSTFGGICSQGSLRVKYICIDRTNVFDICDIPTGQELPSKGYIESPGYGTFYRKNIHCSVQLPSGGTADHVTLEVLDLVLQQDTDGRCIDHLSLTELSGPSDIVTLCGTMVTFTSYNFTQVRVEFNTSNIQHLSLRGFLFRYTVVGYQPFTTSMSTTPEETTTLDLIPTTTEDEDIITTTKTTTVGPWFVHTKKPTKFISTTKMTTSSKPPPDTISTETVSFASSPEYSSTISFEYSSVTEVHPTSSDRVSTTSSAVPMESTGTSVSSTSVTSTSTSSFAHPTGTFPHGDYLAACMDEVFSITCPPDHIIVISEAQYGLIDGSPCKPATDLSLCRVQMTDEIVNSKCSGKNMCTFEVNLDTFLHCDDPGSVLYVKHVCVSANNVYDVCDTTSLAHNEGFISSPGYPNHYPKLLDCFKTLDPGPLNIVMISIHDVSLTAIPRQIACADYMRISEPGNSAHNLTYCGDMSTYGLQLNVMIDKFDIEFFSNDAEDFEKRGFILNYKVIPKEVTKPTTTSTPMPISSKMTTSADSTMHTTMSEEPVKEGLDCTAEANIGAHELCRLSCGRTPFSIQCPEDNTIVISEAMFGTLSSSYSSLCNTSSLPTAVCTPENVYHSAIQACSGESFCVFDIEKYSPSCSSSDNVHMMIQYKCIPRRAMIDICGNTNLPNEGYITSPNYPARVSKMKNCSQILIPSSNESMITYNLIDLDMDIPRLCYDKIEITDPINNEQMTYCGDLEDNKQPVSQNFSALAVRYVHFLGTVSEVRGFMLHYKLINLGSQPDVYILPDITTTPVISTTPPTTTRIPTTTATERTTTALISSTTTTLPPQPDLSSTLTTGDKTTSITSTFTTPQPNNETSNAVEGTTFFTNPTDGHSTVTSREKSSTASTVEKALPDITEAVGTLSTTFRVTTSLPLETTPGDTTTTTATLPSTTPVFAPNTAVSKVIICKDEIKTLLCVDTDEIILVESAKFGVYSDDQCGENVTITHTCDNDIIQDVSSKCTGYNTCTYTVDDSNFPDKKCLASSVLVLNYRCYKKPVDICSKAPLPMPEGLVSSVNYPDPYVYSSNTCTKTISPVSVDATVLTRVYDMDVEKRASGFGCHDYLIMEEYQNPFNYYPYCGNLMTTDYNLLQRFNNLTIRFYTDATNNGKGFLVYYKVVGDVYQSTFSVMPATTSATFAPSTSVQESTANKTPTSIPDVDRNTTVGDTTSSVVKDLTSTEKSASVSTTEKLTTVEPSTTTIQPLIIAPDTPIFSATLCFGDNHTLQCADESDIILVESAKYGVYTETQCGGNTSITRTCDLDVIQEVSSVCSGFNKCLFVVDDVTFSNTKCNKDSTALIIHYRCHKAPIDICSNDKLPLYEGLVASRNYPQHYSYDKAQPKCTKVIQAPQNNAEILLRIYDLDVEQRTTMPGCFDTLYLTGYQNYQANYEYCGNLLTSRYPLQQSFRNLTMSFQPDAITHGKGFLLFYKVVGSFLDDTSSTTLPPPARSTTDGSITISSPESKADVTTNTAISMTSKERNPSSISTVDIDSTINMVTSSTVDETTMVPLTPNTNANSIAVCLGESMSFSCHDSSSILLIESASFGVYSENQCGWNAPITGTCDTDIALQVTAQCTGFKECLFMVDSTNFPSHKCDDSSVLAVTYRCYTEPIDICANGKLPESEGLLASPNYPEPYNYDSDHITCTSQIEPHAYNASVVTRIYDLDLETNTTVLGCRDKLILQNLDELDESDEYCGNMLAADKPLQMEFSSLEIMFQANMNDHRKGFLLYYKVFSDVAQPSPSAITSVSTSYVSSSKPESATTSADTMTSMTEKFSSNSESTTDSGIMTTMVEQTMSESSSVSVSTATKSVTETVVLSSSASMVTSETATTSSTSDVTQEISPDILGTTEESNSSKATPAEAGSSKQEKTYAWVAGVVLAILFVIVLIVIVVFLLIREHCKPKKTVLKPGQRDLIANTYSAGDVNAMNEYTYMDMQNPSHYDSFLPLTAHESALSNSLYDSNRNRNFSQPMDGERVLVVNGNSASYVDELDGKAKSQGNGHPVQKDEASPKQIRLEDVFPPINQETSLNIGEKLKREEEIEKTEEKAPDSQVDNTEENPVFLNISGEVPNHQCEPDNVSEIDSGATVGRVQTNELSDIRIIEIDSSKQSEGGNFTLEDHFPATYETVSSA